MVEETGLTDLGALGAAGIETALVDSTRLLDPAATASRFLTGEELEGLATISHAMRRREWIAARICLKLMVLRAGLIADTRDCRIVKNANGRPRLVSRTGGPLEGVGDCSLSHKGRYACACLCRHGSVRVGVDIEEISPRPLRLRRAFTNPSDAIGGGGSTATELTTLWVLKEAYSKAVGTGIHIGLRNLICDKDPETGELWIRTVGGARARTRHLVYNSYAVGVCFVHQSPFSPAADRETAEF